MRCSRLTASAAILLLFSLTGCSWLGLGHSDDTANPNSGFVVSDEPLATQAGASTLALGGSAADAVTAMYFALAVTYPVAAGLGGGGLCIVHDAATNRTAEVNFLARNSAHGGDYGVPGNVRGFSVLQSAFGRLPWQRDVAPGEGYALTGFPISQALETRIVAGSNIIRLDANLAAEFLNESGQVKPVGTQVANAELGGTLTAIRIFGANAFYRGDVAAKLLMYSTGQGGAFTPEELAAYPVERTAPSTATVGGYTVYLPTRNMGSGAFAQALLARVVNGQGQVTSANPAAAIAVATKDTLEQFAIKSLPRDLGATGFAAADKEGQSVACAVTLNGAFGSGHTAGGTGVILARAPSSSSYGLGGAFITPMIATSSDGSLALAGAGAGGPNGTAALVYAIVRLAAGEDLIAPGRLHSTGLAPYDTINVVACVSGTCLALPDPDAHGLGAATQ